MRATVVSAQSHAASTSGRRLASPGGPARLPAHHGPAGVRARPDHTPSLGDQLAGPLPREADAVLAADHGSPRAVIGCSVVPGYPPPYGGSWLPQKRHLRRRPLARRRKPDPLALVVPAAARAPRAAPAAP